MMRRSYPPLTHLALLSLLLGSPATAQEPSAPETTRAEPAPASAPDGSVAETTRAEPTPASAPAPSSSIGLADDPAPAGAPSAPDQEPDLLDEIWDAVSGGKVSFNLRARAEIADIDGLKKSQAYTERIRLGYGTKPLYGLNFFIEFEDTRAADYDLYNAAGLNGEPSKTVIADPENTELNQFFAAYSHEYVNAKAGRQRLTLDDHRFIGNVGWRQNEQTYDAYTISTSAIENVTLLYSYIDDVNRIFGPDTGTDFRSDSHLLNAAWNMKFDALELGKLTAFAYFLEFSNSPANSSNTVGFRYTGSSKISENFTASYAGSFAHQRDAEENPTDYEANYYAIEGSVARKGWGNIGGGYEVLESDDRNGGSFSTPLATLHAFNGWADQFLVTPVAGLEDVYAFVGFELPYGIKGKVVYHWFYSEEGSSDYGEEFDAMLSKAFTPNFSLLGKIAIYDGRKGSSLATAAQASDLQRYWVQAEVSF